MPNGFYFDQMTPTERLDEVARLLALGYLRLRAWPEFAVGGERARIGP
jgi:hypothetical protein